MRWPLRRVVALAHHGDTRRRAERAEFVWSVFTAVWTDNAAITKFLDG